MKMTIRTRNKGRHYTSEGVRPYQWETVTAMGESGYGSVREMQKELCRRFPNRANKRNRKIKNGIVRVEGIRNSRMTQVITLD